MPPPGYARCFNQRCSLKRHSSRMQRVTVALLLDPQGGPQQIGSWCLAQRDEGAGALRDMIERGMVERTCADVGRLRIVSIQEGRLHW